MTTLTCANAAGRVPAYTEATARQLLDVLGEALPNPHFIGRQS
jgi:hypothetical protein